MSRPKTVFATPVDGHFLVSPNMDHMPPIPLKEIPHEFDNRRLPSATKSIRLSNNRYPFLGFVVTNVQWEGALLNRLRLPSRVPIEPENDMFIFNKDRACRWQRLEVGLVGMIQALGDHFHLTFPVDIGAFPGPVTHGYMEPRSSAKHMVTAVLRARDAFLPLMAFCSYVIALTPKADTQNAPWMKALMDNGVDAQWVQNVRHSPVGSFCPENQRVGVVVHQDCHFPEQIPKFVKAGVPVWIYFRRTPDPEKPCYSRTKIREFYLPTTLEYEQANSAYFSAPVEAPRPPSPVSTSVLPTPASAGEVTHRDGPEPHRQSRQLRGESWQEFFAREDEWQEKQKAKESPEQREKRLRRAEAHKTHPLPGKKGPMCFEWEEDSGYWMRRPLTRGEADQRFGDVADTQRRYNAFRHEWDLCEDFDSNAEQPEWWNDADAVEPEPVSVAPEPASIPPISLYSEDLASEQQRPETNFRLVIDTADKMLTFRHGFALVGDGYPIIQGLDHIKATKNWKDTCNTLGGVEKGPWTGPPQDVVRDFVARISTGMTIPSNRCDLSPNHPARIMYQTDSMSVIRRTSGEHTYYVINPRSIKDGGGLEPAWDLIVRDPTTALECVRRFGGTGRTAIAKHFALTGRAFTTRLVMRYPPPSNTSPGPRVGMGWREANWRPSPHDYAGYWFNLRDWMTTSRARAALMSGGIVWRLCLEVLVQEDVELVLLGPDYAGHGKRVRFDGEQLESWDNELTENDMDVISGVYKMFTGNGDQTADASWWPKQSIWQGSSMDLGYWSPQCEEWYTRRRDLVISGQAGGTPKNAHKWREALQGWKPRKNFINGVQIESASVLRDSTRGA